MMGERHEHGEEDAAAISRRAFLGATAAATAALALSTCETSLAKSLDQSQSSQSSQKDEKEGEWLPVRCGGGCGGYCLNYAYVVDGVATMMKSDDSNPDSFEMPQQRGCLKGKGRRQFVYSPNRLKYPMKRKGWSIDNPNGSQRGIDEWERIDWDEAIDIVASALQKCYDEHGAQSVYCAAKSTAVPRVLTALGGYATFFGTQSHGSYYINTTDLGLNLVNGFQPDFNAGNDRLDLLKADTIVLYGQNVAWASGGNPVWNLQNAKKAGVSFVYVGPSYNVTASSVDARWIRVRPATDTAFLLAVAYVMITEDDPDSNPIIDWDFLDKYTVGFDMDHLPADATVQECFKDYVLGAYDGQPKTPEWATEICGTPVEDIEWYAREMRKDNKVMLLHSDPAARTSGAENLPQLFMTIGAMGGHMGKSGHCCGGCQDTEATNPGTSIVRAGEFFLDGYGEGYEKVDPSDFGPTNPIMDGSFPVANMADVHIPQVSGWKCMLEKKYREIGPLFDDTGSNGTHAPEERDLDIRAIVNTDMNSLGSKPGSIQGIEAFRSVDFVLTLSPNFNDCAQYSDIVLPVASTWESYEPATDMTYYHNREMVVIGSPIIPCYYESLEEEEVARRLSDRLGLPTEKLFPYTTKQQYFWLFASARYLDADGVTWKPVCSLTQDEIDEWGMSDKITPREGAISFDEFRKKGKFQVPRKDGDNYSYIGYKDYVDDPEANPRPSNSGKLEIYCQKKADNVNAVSFGDIDDEVKPYPNYLKVVDGYQDTFSDWENKVKGPYPFQMTTPHYIGGCHTTMTEIHLLREAFIRPCFMNREDAEELGIEEGDTVLVYNQYGKILRQATLTDLIIPGVCEVPHGGDIELDEETGIALGGCSNVLIGDTCGLFPVDPYNSTLVNIEKYDGPALVPDAQRPYLLPEL
jgi:anaerobic dimethyl sulfoxide reductase subunit A